MTKQLFTKAMMLMVTMLFSFSLVLVSGALAGDEVGTGAGMDPIRGVADEGANSVGWRGMQDDIQGRTALGNDDPRNIAANVINIILGFLGILAVVLILYGGFKWMTAAGNEDKVSEAKKLLVAGVIGLIIILAAFALSAFILDAVFRATTQNTQAVP